MVERQRSEHLPNDNQSEDRRRAEAWYHQDRCNNEDRAQDFRPVHETHDARAAIVPESHGSRDATAMASIASVPVK